MLACSRHYSEVSGLQNRSEEREDGEREREGQKESALLLPFPPEDNRFPGIRFSEELTLSMDIEHRMHNFIHIRSLRQMAK